MSILLRALLVGPELPPPEVSEERRKALYDILKSQIRSRWDREIAELKARGVEFVQRGAPDTARGIAKLVVQSMIDRDKELALVDSAEGLAWLEQVGELPDADVERLASKLWDGIKQKHVFVNPIMPPIVETYDTNRFINLGATVEIWFAGNRSQVENNLGAKYAAEIIQSKTPIHCTSLHGSPKSNGLADTPSQQRQQLEAINNERMRIEAEIDAARKKAHQPEIDILEAELERVIASVGRIVGKRGKLRRPDDPARVAVIRAIDRFIAQCRKNDTALADFFDVSLQRSFDCQFIPPTGAAEWVFE